MYLRLACSLPLAVLAVLAPPEPLLAATNSPKSAIPIPAPERILDSLRKEHPRLLLSARDFDSLKQRCQSDEQLRAWHAALREQGGRILREQPVRYEIPDGKRLLAVSRRVLHRSQTLALLYRLDRDPRDRDRLWQELETAANFKDWNPSHFLDTAEMTHAFGIAYDWLHDDWSPAQRDLLHRALVRHGLEEALKVYTGNRWWATARHNWNQVCNGGIGMGALALAEVEPELAGKILSAGLQSIQLAMAEYGPDGAWAEGPGYWNYATSYNVVILAALQTALGTEFGLTSIPGFAEAGLFPLHVTGPTRHTFNYADSGDGAIRAPALFWLARQFNQPAYALYQRRMASPSPLDLVWYRPPADASSPAALPLDKYFHHAEVVCLRNSWDDPNALFVGFKAGDNRANHGHLDLGTFVLDALGQRWAVDLGGDDYNLRGYFGRERWTYYRLRAEGHNTLVLNPSAEPDQDPRAAATVIQFNSKVASASAVADLSPAYARHASQVLRGIRRDGQTVLVQDEVQASRALDAWWFLHTPAKVTLSPDRQSAQLIQGQARLQATILSPPNAQWTIMDARPLPTSPQPEAQRRNDRIRKLAIHLTGLEAFRITVRFAPADQPGVDQSKPQSSPGPLKDW